MKNSSLKKIISTTILVSIAILIDIIITNIPFLGLSMPMGGKIFGISMIPLLLIGLLYGVKHALLGCFLYALYNFSFDYLIYISSLQQVLESYTNTKWSFFQIFLLIFLDYIVAFLAFAISGIFKNGINFKKNIIFSIIFASIIRLIGSTLSGILIWSSSITYANNEALKNPDQINIATRIFLLVNNNIIAYSLIYNSIYIITTGIICLIILISIGKRILEIFNN